MSKSKYYGEEARGGGYECTCRTCKRIFLCLTPLGCYCPGCRKSVIDGLPLRKKDNESVLLDCAKGCGRWVPHVFSRYERVEVHGSVDAVLVYYACKSCGEERLYGHQDPKSVSS